MTEAYDALLIDLLKDYGKNVKRPGKKFAIHVPHEGSEYAKTKLMLVGRALNGAHLPVSEDHMVKAASSIVESRFRTASLDWLQDFRMSRFFDVTRVAMINLYGLSEGNWFEHMTWSNLMKISPSLKGNPTEREYRLQLLHCQKLLKMEIDYLKPKNVLFLTDLDWAYDFLEYLKIDPDAAEVSKKYKFLRAKCNYKKTNILVFRRPEYKNVGKFSNSIIEHIVQ